MKRQDEQCLALGKEIVRMVGDVVSAPATGVAYGRRRFTYPGGEFHLFLCREKQVADALEGAIATIYDVKAIVPPSQVH